jgi:hypothetical protein
MAAQAAQLNHLRIENHKGFLAFAFFHEKVKRVTLPRSIRSSARSGRNFLRGRGKRI